MCNRTCLSLHFSLVRIEYFPVVLLNSLSRTSSLEGERKSCEREREREREKRRGRVENKERDREEKV